MYIQTLDLSQFTKGSESERRAFASDLLSNFSRNGFVKLVNHGIPDSEVSKLWEMNNSFFKLPTKEKQKIANIPGPNPQRGWSHIGAENSATLYQKGLLKSEVKGDLKDAREHFDMGSKNDYQYPNKWLDENVLPGFCATMECAFGAFETISEQILEALEVSLGVPRGTFFDKVTPEKSASEFRFNHYPAIDIKEINGGRVSRIWPHFDLGVITLLFQDSVGGLEFENREEKDTFSMIKCESPSELVVNISETLQRWSNDRLPAGLHRVSIPQNLANKEAGTLPERFSMAYFCKADRDVSVGALKEFVAENSMPHYRDLSAIEYQKQRLESAY
ncbi:hypothetical protein BJ878DRAFT_466590 [Calycina marina]|uniref:Fe2OG dioxygenase domain-containing protein n=1 Tax=Calycina marina TaxID=1763456 RepID=A0A9P7YY97_9HELO|nr:hypothetical protein BJ878DRAFT_466590 [Calycina marina]